MKITTTNNTTKHLIKPYPKLMVSAKTKLIVLFIDYAEGTLIDIGNKKNFTIGEWSNDWDMESFVDFKGSITLEQ